MLTIVKRYLKRFGLMAYQFGDRVFIAEFKTTAIVVEARELDNVRQSYHIWIAWGTMDGYSASSLVYYDKMRYVGRASIEELLTHESEYIRITAEALYNRSK